MLKRVLILFFILPALLLSACGNRVSGPTRGDVIVYVGVPLSGFQANGGQTVLGGVRLAAEEINRSGGLLGYRVVVRPLDDESDSDTAVANVDEIRRAISSGERVLGVIGHLNSGQTDATLDLYADLGLVVITPTASEQSLTARGHTNFFRVNANDAVQAAVDARFLAEQMDATRVAVIHNDTDYGKGLAASLAQLLGEHGAAEAVRLEVSEGQSDYTAVVQRLRNVAVDAIFYAGYEIEAPYLRASLVDAGINLPMLASDGAFLAATIDESDGAAEGMYISAFAPSPQNAANSKWIEAYQAVEYRDPDTYSINGYVAMQVLAEGARKADSVEMARIAAALRGNAIPTLLGNLRFDAQGDLIDPAIWIYQVQNSEFKQVEQ
ncbi:MAG: branched-chain amino acid ABC transporter substrate-binding protein [Caldilineaceae bacterium]|nr:branched-chain amino acid ABC transporter substrate-binding protein [Caldilineaceae bacterium]